MIEVGSSVGRASSAWKPGDLQIGDEVTLRHPDFIITGTITDYFVDGIHTPSVVIKGVGTRLYLNDNLVVTVEDRYVPIIKPGMKFDTGEGVYTLVLKNSSALYGLMNDNFAVSTESLTEKAVIEQLRKGLWKPA